MANARADQWMKLQKFEIRLCFTVNNDVGLDLRGRALVIEDGPQSPRDDNSARKVAVDGRERVGG